MSATALLTTTIEPALRVEQSGAPLVGFPAGSPDIDDRQVSTRSRSPPHRIHAFPSPGRALSHGYYPTTPPLMNLLPLASPIPLRRSGDEDYLCVAVCGLRGHCDNISHSTVPGW